jgi:uncharacterized protein (DUF2126 family)
MCCRCSAGTPAASTAPGSPRNGRPVAVSCSSPPGDSPAGYRLPLSSLKHIAPTEYPHVVAMDPGAPRGSSCPIRRKSSLRQTGLEADPRPPGHLVLHCRQTSNRTGPSRKSARSKVEVRTAVTAEIRDHRLCVFLPPVEKLEDYLELIGATEAAAKEIGQPVHLEGYAPPHDPRLNVIRVAPDPGVIEVNIHPAPAGTIASPPPRRSMKKPASPGSAPTSS